jgi:Tol biopolymer transport system component
MRRSATVVAVSFVGIIGWLVAVPASAEVVEPPESHSPALSTDGRWLAFISTSGDLLEGDADANGYADAFLLDLQTGTLQLISRLPGGGATNGPTTEVDVSADGRYVAFVTEATNLLATDLNGADSDVFVYDTLTGNLQLVSRRGATGAQGNARSWGVSISEDGSKLAFTSYSTNLVSGDTNGQPDAFVRDLAAPMTTRVSTNSNGKEAASATLKATISGNGSVVAFQNTSKLVSTDTNGRRDVYVKILGSGKTAVASVTNGEKPANLDSTLTDISRNGRYVAFTSIATNLVAGDDNRLADAFVRDRSGGSTTRVSRAGAVEANGTTYDAAISPDGTYVMFSTAATNLGGDVPDENGTALDMYEFDMATKELRHPISDATGGWADGATFDPTYGSSSIVAFTSWATDLAASDADADADVFTRGFAEDRSSVAPATHRSGV